MEDQTEQFHLISIEPHGSFEVVNCTVLEAKQKGHIIRSDSTPEKLKLICTQLERFSEWKIHVENSSIHTKEVPHKPCSESSKDQVEGTEQISSSNLTTSATPGISSDTPRKSNKYSLSDDECDPYATDEDEDYVCGSTVSSSSSSCERVRLRKKLTKNVKRSLFASTSTEKSTFPVQSSQSKNCLLKQHGASSLPVSPSRGSACSESSSTQSTSSTWSASFKICPASSNVTFKTYMVLHKGSKYKCNLCQFDEYLLGFLKKLIPDGKHLCEHAPTNEQDWTYMLLHRKPRELEATVQVMFCTPIADFRGKEITTLIDGMFATPLTLATQQQNLSKIKGSKKHCCFYCQKMLVEISSHLVKQHGEEQEVRELVQLKANSKERNAALKKLRLKGDAHYNETVAVNHRIPLRKLQITEKRDCITCANCSALLATKNFARHERKCTGRGPTRRRVAAEARENEHWRKIPTNNNLRDMLMGELLEPMRSDSQSHEIMSDFCLQQLAVRYAYMHRNNPTALRNDRQHLRRLARLLMEIRDVDATVIDFEDCILNISYDSVLEAVYRLCDLNDDTGEFGKPALAQVLRSAITMLVKALSNSYLKKGLFKESIECQTTDRFLTLHNDNYGVYIGRSAGRTRLQQKAKRQTDLPDPKDIKLFSMYITDQARTAYEKLEKNGYSYENWLRLGQAELARTIVFNRRRVSEVALMSVDLFKKRTSLDPSKKQSLTALEKALADQYSIMKLVGKRAHILHLLLNEEQCKHLEMFISLRKMAGVSDSNDYLFGLPTRALYIDASAVSRNFSVQCGAAQPRLLRATYLRKQVATMSQLLSLNDNQISQVARFMGHSKEVHNNFYRQDEQLFQVTSWAKFLLLVDDEDINKYKGKTLDQIVNLMQEVPILDDDPNQEEHIAASDILDIQQAVELQEATSEELTTMEIDDYTEERNFDCEAEVTESSKEAKSLNQMNFRTSLERKKINKRKRKEETPKKLSSKKGTLKIRTPTKGTPQKGTQQNLTPKKKQTISEILHTLKTSPRRVKKKVFGREENRLLTLKFSQNLKSGHLPRRHECESFLEDYAGVFVDRNWRDVYNWVQYNRNKRRITK